MWRVFTTKMSITKIIDLSKYISPEQVQKLCDTRADWNFNDLTVGRKIAALRWFVREKFEIKIPYADFHPSRLCNKTTNGYTPMYSHPLKCPFLEYKRHVVDALLNHIEQAQHLLSTKQSKEEIMIYIDNVVNAVSYPGSCSIGDMVSSELKTCTEKDVEEIVLLDLENFIYSSVEWSIDEIRNALQT